MGEGVKAGRAAYISVFQLRDGVGVVVKIQEQL